MIVSLSYADAPKTLQTTKEAKPPPIEEAR
jgi:hypothetical protein